LHPVEQFQSKQLFLRTLFRVRSWAWLEKSLLSRIYFNSFDFKYSVPGDSYPSLVDDGKGGYTTQNSSTSWDWEGKYSLVTLDILPKITIPYLKLGFFAGPSVSYLTESKYTEIYRILTPEQVQFKRQTGYEKLGYRYADHDRTVYLKEGKIPYKNDFRFGIKAGLTYDFEFWGLRLSPFVSIDYPLNSVVNGANTSCSPAICALRKDAHWRILFMQAGMDLKYMF